MAELSNGDVETLYGNCLMIYKGALVKIVEIHFGIPRTFTILNLSTQKRSVVDFNPEDFKSPEKRIGFVNMMQSVMYVARLPVRKYHLGIHSGNIEIRQPSVKYPQERSRTRENIARLSSIEIYNAYANKYPSLRESFNHAKAWTGACAFDKQFAVDHRGFIWYKDLQVGTTDGEKIVFTEPYSYLEIVLENHYEKTSRTFRATPL